MSSRRSSWRTCAKGWSRRRCGDTQRNDHLVNGEREDVNRNAVTSDASPLTFHLGSRSDLQELYQSIILDHNRRPKNYGTLEGATTHKEGRNPSCGDEIVLELKVENDAIADVRFTSAGCAVSRASASIMTQAVKGKTRQEADRLFTQF